jgi:hypothetical protein
LKTGRSRNAGDSPKRFPLKRSGKTTTACSSRPIRPPPSVQSVRLLDRLPPRAASTRAHRLKPRTQRT